MKRRSPSFNRFDAATIRQATSAPGQDTRQWCSYGIVDSDQGDTQAVEFDSDWGPLVLVTLQPSGIPVRCRLSSMVAGAGESEYHPFVPGDEVIVLVPEGDERAGPCIVGRLNQKLDSFPTLVGGNDTTKNAVAFKRLVSPYVLESKTALMFRVSTPGSFISMSPEGNISLSDGNKSFFHIGSDFIGAQSGDGTMMLQGNLSTGEWRIESQRDPATILRIGGSQPGIQTSSTFTISTNGQIYPFQHALTLEQFFALMIPIMGQIAAGNANWTDLLDPGPVYAARSLVLSNALTAAASSIQLTATGVLTPPLIAQSLSGATPANPISGATGGASQVIL